MLHTCKLNTGRAQRVTDRTLLIELKEFGFFSFVPEDDLEQVFASILKSGEIFADEIARSFYLDEEDVYEQGISILFVSASAVISPRGITLPEFQESIQRPSEYIVSIGGKRYPIITPSVKRDKNPWHAATLNALEVFWELLKNSSYEEDIYFDPGSGNDGTVYLLSQRMFSCLERRGVLSLIAQANHGETD